MVTSLKWINVTSKDVRDTEFRLEASVFNVDVKKAKQDINNSKYPKRKIWGDDGFILKAHYGGRAKRNYISKENQDAIGFLGSAEMLHLNPKPENFLSRKQEIESFKVKEGTILISRSGTIGNLTYVNKTLSKFLVSEHAIRLEPNEFGGYLYAFLKTKTGQLLVQGNIYGAVISQIEPEHIGSIEIPKPSTSLRSSIHQKIAKSFEIRDKSNDLIHQAEQTLIKALNIPPIYKMRMQQFKKNAGVNNYNVSLSLLDNRFDASYHAPIVNEIIDCLLDSSQKVLPLGSNDLTTKIFLPLRFKRVYVNEENGMVFFGGKQIYEIDPSNKKYLSLSIHGSRIADQLLLRENMILVTRSGTVGRVNIVPKHLENWVANDHILRITPKSRNEAGYLYVWLNSEYGRILTERFIYGAVVDEIEAEHLAKLPVPILRDAKLVKKINELALEANKLRTEAYNLEQAAIKQVNEEVIFV